MTSALPPPPPKTQTATDQARCRQRHEPFNHARVWWLILTVTRFPTAAHLVSWTGLAPVTRQSGPRARKPGKGQGDVYLKGYCTQAATGAATTDTFLGERLRRLSRRLGGNRARCAVGRSILVIVWHLLSDPGARFADLGSGWHDSKAGRDRKIRAHVRQLQSLGLDVSLTPAAA